VSARGRRPKLDGATRFEDDVSIAAAVEWTRRQHRFKPLRDGNKRGREGVYRFVARVFLGDRLGPDAVEQSYRRWRKGARALAVEKLQAIALALRDKYNPPPDHWIPNDDSPLENPRHRRWYERNRLRGPSERRN